MEGKAKAADFDAQAILGGKGDASQAPEAESLYGYAGSYTYKGK